MLTSYRYLLGSCTAAFFTAGILHLAFTTAQRLPPSFSEQTLTEAVSVSHRGSGRLDTSSDERKGNPKNHKESFLISHRGSGRVQPSTL